MDFSTNPKRYFLYLVSVYLILRILFIFLFIDLELKDYKEFGYIIENIHHGNGYSLFSFMDGKVIHEYNSVNKPYPSAYMPPGYVFFLYPFFYINDLLLRNLIILSTQIIIGIGILLLLFKLTSKFFTKKIAYIACWIYVLIPEFIYSTLVFNSIVIYHLLVLLSFLLLYKIEKKGFRTVDTVILSLIFITLIYFRPEFALFVLFVLIWFLIKRKFKNALLMGAVIVIFATPWIIRNYNVFNKFVPMTTTSGLNFYRGNNNLYLGNWGDNYIIEKIKENSSNPNYEVIMNDIYTQYSFEIIKSNPFKFVKDAAIKFVYYISVNPNEINSLNPAYFIPWIFVLLLALYGIYKTYDFKKYMFFYLFFIYSILIAVIFLPLPRYQILMKILLLPFAGFGIFSLLPRRLRSKNINNL